MTRDAQAQPCLDARLMAKIEDACQQRIEQAWRGASGISLRLGRSGAGVVERPGRTRFDLRLAEGQWRGALRSAGAALPFARGSLALVVLDRVLGEFGEEAEAMLDEALACLAEDGRLLIVDCHPWAWVGLRMRLARQRPGLAPRGIEAWLRARQLRDIQLDHALPWPPLPAALLLRLSGVLERVGGRLWPGLGSLYALSARKRGSNVIHIPLAPRARAAGILAAPEGMRRAG